DGMQVAVAGEALDRRDLEAVGLDSQHGARLDRLAFEQHRARAARGRVAADVRARQAELLSQEVDEQLPRLDLRLPSLPVDGHSDALHATSFVGRPSINGPGAAGRY